MKSWNHIIYLLKLKKVFKKEECEKREEKLPEKGKPTPRKPTPRKPRVSKRKSNIIKFISLIV